MEPNNPAAAQPDAPQLNAADPGANVGTPAPAATTQKEVEALSLPELNQLLGRDFKTKDSALKSIKDTFSFATARVTDVTAKAVDQMGEGYKKLAENYENLQRDMFFQQNPQYAPHRKLITSLGSNPSEVVQGDVFKETFSQLEEHGKTVKLRTVLESNPRLASSRDSMTKAAELKRSNNGFVTAEVERLALQSVKDAFDLN